jgi:protein-disulfide isomerase
MIVEYADIDSPYAKQLERNLEQLMAEHASRGDLAWVFRHFPLIDLHPHAGETAMAAECAAMLGTPQTFWRFIDLVQAAAPNENQFDPANYPAVAGQLGISSDALASCIAKGTFGQKVAEDAKNAVEAGAEGSPYVVLIVRGREPVSISGSIPYASLKKIVDEVAAGVQ